MHVPSGEVLDTFDAAARYISAKTPTVILAGADYGSGSSRDWAAKGPYLLGVRAGTLPIGCNHYTVKRPLPPPNTTSDCGVIRAHSSQQPGGHGYRTPAVPRGSECRVAGPHWQGALLH